MVIMDPTAWITLALVFYHQILQFVHLMEIVPMQTNANVKTIILERIVKLQLAMEGIQQIF
jgi:hypothetical protein